MKPYRLAKVLMSGPYERGTGIYYGQASAGGAGHVYRLTDDDLSTVWEGRAWTREEAARKAFEAWRDNNGGFYIRDTDSQDWPGIARVGDCVPEHATRLRA